MAKRKPAPAAPGDYLLDCLRKLPPEGARGFEGLIRELMEAWIDLRGMPDGEGHYIPDQGEAVLSLLRQAHGDGVLHDVFVISPFRTVAQGMRDAADRANLPESWIKTKIGTVHTFQGKEAKMVILLLGGHPNRPGALDWAASKPNLLNVAVTRAKRAIYVVGDREKWGRLPYFETLARELG